MQVSIQGTVKELSENGLRVNGKPVTQQMLSVLIRMGACEEVGQEQREDGQKGPSAKVYRFGGEKLFNFTVDNKKQQSEQKPKEAPEAEKKTPARRTTDKQPEPQETPEKALEDAVKVDAGEAIAKVFQEMPVDALAKVITALQGLQKTIH